MSIKVLKFLPTEISKEAKNFLGERFMKEDYESIWLSIDALLEELADEWMDDIVVDPDSIDWDKTKLSDIPKAWWKKMSFPPKIEKDIKAFWKKNPSGEIEWSW